MKTLDWQSFFAEQKELNDKTVFSVAELANAAHTGAHSLNTELGRLVRRGVVKRYTHGLYGASKGVKLEHLVPAIDSGAYITGFYALSLNHFVTQVPVEITCFTNRRHNRRSDQLEAAKLRFICVPASIYAKPARQLIAVGEQALCDFTWLSLREAIDPRSLVTFRNLGRLSRRRLKTILRRYPENVRGLVERITTAV